MNKQKITEYLTKFDYDFKVEDDIIIVKLDFNLRIYIDISHDVKIKIYDKLKALNFLTWPYSTSIKGSMLYNFISSVIVLILFALMMNDDNNYMLILIVIFVAFWNLYWLLYYLHTSLIFQREIKNLVK